MAAQWYQNHLGTAVRVLLITNDRENKRKAINDGIPAETGMKLFIVSARFVFASSIKNYASDAVSVFIFLLIIISFWGWGVVSYCKLSPVLRYLVNKV